MLSCTSLVVYFFVNYNGLLVRSRTLEPSIDLPALFKTVDETMRLSKVASTLEFTLVASVSGCGPRRTRLEAHCYPVKWVYETDIRLSFRHIRA